ncbi:zinc ABC transporter substrate-binding protein [Terrabacter terrae]|uniref:Zinc ABC transporter substrate-binding protein n=2 Tax=Terrabacter terrae TaxID=318434 RepID=A0ABN2TRE2_9MICO
MSPMSRRLSTASFLRRLILGSVAAALTMTVAACSPGPGAGGDAAGAVVTSFYPLQFATEQIAGGRLAVTVLTKPGAEPHDLELAPQDVAALTKARLVVYSDGFQPAVDDAVAQSSPASVLDVADAARLTLPANPEPGGQTSSAQQATPAPAGGHGSADPHFWLDPQRYAAVVQTIGKRLESIDPKNAATYAKNTTTFVARLTALDAEYKAGLRQCRSKVLVTSHAAFGYLAQRYGLEQHGISGISPDTEPSAASLQAISQLVRKDGVTTIYQETLVAPQLAQTVAATTGATVATLDPIEGITGSSAGKDYFAVMHSNLAAIQKGLGCS